MNFKKILCLSLAVMAITCLCSCLRRTELKTVADLAYTRSGETACIFVLEHESYVPFLVLTDDYYGKTLLLRKDVTDEPMRVNEYSSYYAQSEISLFLNNIYLSKLSELSSYIAETKLDIAANDTIGTAGTKTEKIAQKVFLLSCSEIGISESVNIANEGKALDYFKNEENRVAYKNGIPFSWWLRSPHTYYTSCTHVVGANNKIGAANSYDENGIRPAFCVDGNMQIEYRDDIVPNQTVYVFNFNK